MQHLYITCTVVLHCRTATSVNDPSTVLPKCINDQNLNVVIKLFFRNLLSSVEKAIQWCHFFPPFTQIWLFETGFSTTLHLPPRHIAQNWSRQACLGFDHECLYLTTQIWFRDAACVWALMYVLTGQALCSSSRKYTMILKLQLQVHRQTESYSSTEPIPPPPHIPVQTQTHGQFDDTHTLWPLFKPYKDPLMTVFVRESEFTTTNCIIIILLTQLTLKVKDCVDSSNTFQAQAANNRRKDIK